MGGRVRITDWSSRFAHLAVSCRAFIECRSDRFAVTPGIGNTYRLELRDEEPPQKRARGYGSANLRPKNAPAVSQLPRTVQQNRPAEAQARPITVQQNEYSAEKQARQMSVHQSRHPAEKQARPVVFQHNGGSA